MIEIFLIENYVYDAGIKCMAKSSNINILEF
jgi:hypothetical protein